MQREVITGDVVLLDDVTEGEDGIGIILEEHEIVDGPESDTRSYEEKDEVPVFHGGAILRGLFVGKRVRVTIEVLGDSPRKESGERPDMEEVNERE